MYQLKAYSDLKKIELADIFHVEKLIDMYAYQYLGE